jgi:hypothetical protein
MKDESTINGLLQKREELQRANAELRERMAIVSNDIEAIDRVLDAFGYQGQLEGRTARAARIVLFYRNELREYLLAELRKADRPLSSRELAGRVCQIEGKDGRDRRLIADVTRRVGCALRKMRAAKIVTGERDKHATVALGCEYRDSCGYMREVGARLGELLFVAHNRAGYLIPLALQCLGCSAFGHAPNLGEASTGRLWRLRHNTGIIQRAYRRNEVTHHRGLAVKRANDRVDR